MRSKNLLILTSLIILSVSSLVGCGTSLPSDTDENLIGNKLQAVSAFRKSDGSANSTIAVFDEQLRKIHEFDVEGMKKTRTLKVENPGEQHFVAHSPEGGYIVDMTLKGLTVFEKSGRAQVNPIKLQGKPKSAVFAPDLGYLIMYDELQSVGMIKLSAEGKVTNAVGLGPLLGEDATIVSGDLSGDGRLVLSMSNGYVYIVNVAQTIVQKKWVFSKLAIQNGPYSWVAPIRGQPQRMLMRNRSTIAIVDLDSGNSISSLSIPGTVKKVDPHIITQEAGDKVNLIYVQNGVLTTRILYRNVEYVVKSQLDLASDEWRLMHGNDRYVYDIFSNELNLVKSGRRLERYRVSDLFAQGLTALADTAQVYLGADYIFSLFPTDLGYAVRQEIETGSSTIMEKFNIREY
jgi:hypothetical protein